MSDLISVANPSSTPEIGPAAAGLARAGLLDRYYAPVITTGTQRARVRRVLPWVVERRVSLELRRRALPEGVPVEKTRWSGTVDDALWVVASRSRLPLPRQRLRLEKERRFDRRVARRVRRESSGVLAVAGTALETLRSARSRDSMTFLDCPLTHHRYTRDLMLEEARLEPTYAPTLQFHDLPDRLHERLDEELRLADHLLMLSTFERETFANRGIDPDRMTTISPGVDADLFRPMPRTRDGRFNVLFVGQISQRKGISYLVKAVERAGIDNAELTFVGAPIGPTAAWAGAARHRPAVPREALPSVYAECDVCVLPSLAEGFGLTALEAMACGRPVIVSDHTFGADVVSDGTDGFVIPIRDPDAIAERLLHLRRDPDEAERMGRAARKRAEQLSWRTYGDRVGTVVEGALAARRSSHSN